MLYREETTTMKPTKAKTAAPKVLVEEAAEVGVLGAEGDVVAEGEADGGRAGFKEGEPAGELAGGMRGEAVGMEVGIGFEGHVGMYSAFGVAVGADGIWKHISGKF